MFEIFPRQVTDEVKAITAARIDLWTAMNSHVLACIGELARLNVDASQKFLADTLEAMKQNGCTQSDEAPQCERYFFVPQDAGFFALYFKEAGNLYATMQQEIVKFTKRSFDETVRDVPLLSPYAVSPDSASEQFVHMRHAGEADNGTDGAAAAAAVHARASAARRKPRATA